MGIGANTAIFSLIDAVLLRSLPVREPEKLVFFGRSEWGVSLNEFLTGIGVAFPILSIGMRGDSMKSFQMWRQLS
jgi:hypothetical protein